ncbi:ribonuclease HII [Alteribacter salitolerans]|uniref:ribonuclease HII n=1 Tax=Alteribacter salitolerans TaxID=2912333 RepID=UPI001F0014FE|nr:ribonuclease HII [Alteribacter salitolerans]
MIEIKKMSISKIKEELHDTADPEFIRALEDDTRKGVQVALRSYYKRIAEEKVLAKQFATMNTYEDNLKHNGFKAIAGIDEVGRGPLAGPVIAASVILPDDFYLPGLTDSKKLSKDKREQFASIIKKTAEAVGIGVATAKEIDHYNIYEATKIAMQRAILDMKKEADYLLLDAMTLPVTTEQMSLIKGDSKSVSIAAASVVAKVERDQYMTRLAGTLPEYGFDKHMGYGTKDHLTALRTAGITKEHRKSFAPVKDLM